MFRSLFICAALISNASCFSTNYLIKDIGLIGIEESLPVAINDRGDVLGYVYKNKKDEKIFLWTEENGLSILDKIPSNANVNALNNNGQVVGSYDYLECGWFSQKWVLHSFIWSQKDGFVDLGSIDSKDTNALGIDDEGNVILVKSENECYKWKNKKFSKIDAVTGLLTQFNSDWDNVVINNVGHIAFVKANLNDKKNPYEYLLLDHNTNEFRPFVNKVNGTPNLCAMNNLGDIIGFANINGKDHGFTILHDEMVVKDYHENFIPYAINDERIVVGGKVVIESDNYIGYIQKNGELIEISQIMRPPEEQPTSYSNIGRLVGINNQGKILGQITVFSKPNVVILEPQDDN